MCALPKRVPAKAFVRFVLENDITSETFTLAAKCLSWCYFAASAGRFGENDIINPRSGYFGSQVSVLGLFCGCCWKASGKMK